MVTWSAFLVCQISIVDCPALMVVGLAWKLRIVGCGCVTVTVTVAAIVAVTLRAVSV